MQAANVIVPQWHVPYDRVAYWDKFGRPSVVPDQGVQIETWWVDADKAAKLGTRGGNSGASASAAPAPAASSD